MVARDRQVDATAFEPAPVDGQAEEFEAYLRCGILGHVYVARPPVSQERPSQAPDGRRLAYSFNRAWKDARAKPD